MPIELSIGMGLLWSYLIVFVHVSGLLLFMPLPGIASGPGFARLALAMALTFCIATASITAASSAPMPGDIVVALAVHFASGIAAGVVVALFMEICQIATQVVGVQAGFSYASTIDPATQADTGVLQSMAQLAAGFLFFVLGLDQRVVAAIADGMRPERAGTLAMLDAGVIARLGAQTLAAGLKLALPVMGFLLLVDLCVALVSRLNAQLQMLSVSFPLKMLAAFLLFALTLRTWPALLENAAAQVIAALGHV